MILYIFKNDFKYNFKDYFKYNFKDYYIKLLFKNI